MKLIKSKKGAEGIWYFFLALGAFLFVSSVIYGLATRDNNLESNPLFGRPGEKEYYLLAVHEGINSELVKLDISARYALHAAIGITAENFGRNIRDNCGSYLGSPIVNEGFDACKDSDYVKELKEEFDYQLYRNFLISKTSLPFKYDYSITQDDDRLKMFGFSREALKIPLNPKTALNVDSAIASGQITFDVLNTCHYLFDNKQFAYDEAGKLRDGFSCQGEVCNGPCPANANMKKVPYFNQCHVAQCSGSSCHIDLDEICHYGCGFKSQQMAFNYYGYYFDETTSDKTYDVIKLIPEMKQLALEEGLITYETGIISDDIISGGTVYGETVDVVRSITEENYRSLVEKVSKDLVVLRLRNMGRCPTRREVMQPCPSQHFVLVVGANDEFVILNDPWTWSDEKQINYGAGANVVITKETLKTIWTGRYVVISGTPRGELV